MRAGVWVLGLGLMGQAAVAEPPKVVTDIAPVHSLVSMVMGDLGAPVLLLPAGADAHDFQLRPSQAKDLSDAELIVWIGPELTPWLERGMEGVGTKARSVPLLAAGVTVLREFGAAAGGHDHSAKHEHGSDDHGPEEHGPEEHGPEEHGHEGHGHSGIDPHAWLDPENARNWLDVIAAELAALDPENAAGYAANAATWRAQIDASEAQVTGILAPVKDQPFAVFHDAYGYFTDHFGLHVAGSLREGDAANPGAAHMRELENTLKAGGAVCIFPEANHDDAAAVQLAEAAGVRLGDALDPAGASVPTGAGHYGAMMYGLAAYMAECLKPR